MMNDDLKKDAHKLADQITAKHGEHTRIIAMMSITADTVCAMFGHNVHQMILVGMDVYCEDHGITVEQVNACREDIEKAEKTLMELSVAAATDQHSGQGVGFGTDFLNRFKNYKG